MNNDKSSVLNKKIIFDVIKRNKIEKKLSISPPQINHFHFNVENNQQIRNIMKEVNDIKINNIMNNLPVYNYPYGNDLYVYFKDPPQNLIGVYFESRLNPSNIVYPAKDFRYSLSFFYYQKLTIKNIYHFWNINNIMDIQPKIHYIKDNINLQEVSYETYVKNYLQTHFKKDLLVLKDCYNISPYSGLIYKLPINLQNKNIRFIYFDDGYRFIEKATADIEYCKKLSNGAKNIYFFELKSLHPLKNHSSIILNPLLKPEDVMCNWMQQYYNFFVNNSFMTIMYDNLILCYKFQLEDFNNIYNIIFPKLNKFYYFYPAAIDNLINDYQNNFINNSNQISILSLAEQIKFIENQTIKCFLNHMMPSINNRFIYKDYDFKIVDQRHYQFSLLDNTTKQNFFILLVLSPELEFKRQLVLSYEKNLSDWKENAIFKAGIVYSSEDIKIILGNYNRVLYTNESDDIINQKLNMKLKPFYHEDGIYSLNYRYDHDDLFNDNWYFHTISYGYMLIGNTFSVDHNIYFSTDVSFIIPPKKPVNEIQFFHNQNLFHLEELAPN